MASISGRALAPYLILFATLYAGFGVQSPYLPALLGEHGLAPEMIGIVLAGAPRSGCWPGRWRGVSPIGSTQHSWSLLVARWGPR